MRLVWSERNVIGDRTGIPKTKVGPAKEVIFSEFYGENLSMLHLIGDRGIVKERIRESVNVKDLRLIWPLVPLYLKRKVGVYFHDELWPFA